MVRFRGRPWLTVAAVDIPTRFRRQTRQTLEAAGWHAGRAVDTRRWEAELTADGFPVLHPVAVQFLAEFGGLAVPDRGSGFTRAREPFSLLPTGCTGEADRFIEWGDQIGRNIAPIGELAVGTCACAFLGIDEQEEVYVVVDALATFGRMPQAMDHLVLGYRSRDIS